MIDNLKKQADKIIQKNLYMTISVASKKGAPWIANIYYVTDNKYNFYWYSPKDSVHSTKIRENSSIAISIFDSHASGDSTDALYIQAKAYEITDKAELIQGLILYAAKMIRTKFANPLGAKRFVKQYGDFTGLSKLRMYKAVPERFWKLAPAEIFNEKFIDSRIEVTM